MAVKSYLDLSGLSHFHDMAIADKISSVAFYEPCGSAEVADATYTAENSPYYSKSGDTYTRVAVTAGTSVSGYYHYKAANTNETKVAPSIKATVDHVDAEVEEAVETLGVLINAKVSSVSYDTTNSKLIYTNGGNHDIVSIDTTAGGTSASTSLITSGAVNSGLASVSAAKVNKNILTTTGDIYYASAASTPARLGIGTSGQVLTVVDGVPAWSNAAETGVTDVKLNDTSVVTSGVANLTADTTSGGTASSADLITSGAVNAGLSTKANSTDIKDSTITLQTNDGTAIDSFTLNQSSNKTITLPELGSVDDVTLNGTSVVANKVAALTADTTPGGTYQSTSLITSGAVNEGFGSLSAEKIDKATLTTTGDIIYASAASTPARLGIGTSGQVLTVVDGVPAWANGGSGSGDVTGPSSSTDADVVVFDGTTGKVIKDSGYTIGTSVPADAVFTDHITTATTSGTGNAVTSITADANGALTVTKGTTFLTSHQDISGKADLASPALTGTPTAPTAAAGTSTTQIATTAFVMAAIQTAIQNVMSASY